METIADGGRTSEVGMVHVPKEAEIKHGGGEQDIKASKGF